MPEETAAGYHEMVQDKMDAMETVLADLTDKVNDALNKLDDIKEVVDAL